MVTLSISVPRDVCAAFVLVIYEIAKVCFIRTINIGRFGETRRFKLIVPSALQQLRYAPHT